MRLSREEVTAALEFVNAAIGEETGQPGEWDVNHVPDFVDNDLRPLVEARDQPLPLQALAVIVVAHEAGRMVKLLRLEGTLDAVSLDLVASAFVRASGLDEVQPPKRAKRPRRP